MLRLSAVLLFLVGCSGVQGVPRAPAFSPVLDAPITIGHPGHVSPPKDAPRGTDRRVLPPTKEPGIWASDRLKASAADDELPKDPILLGVRLPFPENAGDDVTKRPTCACAFYMDLAVNLRREMNAVRYLTDVQRKCLAAQLYLACASGEERRNFGVPAYAKTAQAVSKAAEAFTAKMCKGDQPDAEVKRIIGKVVPVWNQFAGIPEAQ